MTSRICTLLLCAITGAWAASYVEDVIVRPGQTIFSLSHSLVTVDSLRWEDSTDTLRWALDPVEGRWVVLENPDSVYKVKIFYSTPDWTPPIRYSTSVQYLPELFPEKKETPSPSAQHVTPASGVQTRGTLFRSVQVSTQGQSSIAGGMDLKIHGELLPDVMLTGVISDHEIPFESAMSSQSLEELDQIYLELETPGGKGRMGDVNLQTAWSPFSRYASRLTGVVASSPSESSQSLQWEAFAGSPSGRFMRQEIAVREGDQGPYRLLPNAGSSVIIVPGSERVFLNGIQLTSSSYLMDYAGAEITFSTEHLLSKDDRVFVEYRYRNEWFPRLSMGSNLNFTHKKGGLSLYALRESDDASRPLDETMASISSDSLTKLVEGDFLSTAFPDTNGSYTWSEHGYWNFVGEKKGTHSVRFYRENHDGGYIRRYDEQGLPYYEYAPHEPLSQYFPRRPAIFPETRTHFGGGFRWKILQGNLAGNLTVSQFERGFRQGTAIEGVGGNWHASIPFANVTLKSTGWTRSTHFVNFEPLESVSFSRDMGFHPQDTILFNVETSVGYNSEKYTSSLGWQSAGKQADSLRHRVAFSGSIGEKAVFLWNGFRLRDASSWLPYYHMDVTGEIRGNHIFYTGWETTLFEPLHGAYSERHTSIRTGVKFQNNTHVQYQYRDDYEWTGTHFDHYSTKHDLQVKGALNVKEYLRWQGDITGRLDQRNLQQEINLLTSNRFQWSIPTIKLSGQITTYINQTSEYRREALFIRVSDGMGQYRWDDDYKEFVPDPLGNYILRREQTNDRFDQVIHKSSSIIRWQHQFKRFSLRYQGSGDVEYQGDDLIVYQNLSLTIPQNNLLTANTFFKNNVTLTSPQQKRSLRLVTENNRAQNTRDIHSESLSGKDKGEIYWRIRNEKGYQEYSSSISRDQRERFPLGTYSIKNDRQGVKAEFNRAPSPSFNFGGSAGYTHIATTFQNKDFTSHQVESEVNGTWNRIPGEFINGRVQLVSVSTTYDGPLPYEVANGLPAGRTLQIMLRYERRLSEMVSLNGTLQYRKRGETQSVTLIRLEARAYL